MRLPCRTRLAASSTARSSSTSIEWCLRRVVRCERARRARRGGVRRSKVSTERFLDRARGDPARTQQARRGTRQIHDRGLDADVRLATVEHALHGVTKFLPHVLRRRGGNASEAVRRRRRDATAEPPQQLLRHRMRRHAQCHGVLAAGHDVIHLARALQDDGERPGPELLRELAAPSPESAVPNSPSAPHRRRGR